MKIAVLTLGCKTNQAESLQIEQSFSSAGHQLVDISEDPDLCIINTCTVTSRADYQSRQLINRALKNNSKVIATGCYVELNHEHLSKPGIDIRIVRNADKLHIIKEIEPLTSSFNLRTKKGRHRPAIKVQDGCDHSCSYCAIPLARGKSRSIPPDSIIEDIRDYENLGYNEIILTGIHLGTYGLDLNSPLPLSSLLKAILLNTKIPRIRLSSLELKEIDEELLEVITDSRICKHLHIPLQSGDDTILKLMNRTYTVKEYYKGLERITNRFQDIGLGTDIIVGFPGEGDAEFSNTKSLVGTLPFSYLHVFPYSPRPFTRALALPGHVHEQIKKHRAAVLRGIGDSKKTLYIQRHIGKILEVLIESRSERGIIATTDNYIKVLISENNILNAGMLAKAQLSGIRDNMAIGILLNNP